MRYILISFSFLTILCLGNRLQAQNEPEKSRTAYFPFLDDFDGWSFANLEGRLLGEFFDSIRYNFHKSGYSIVYRDGLVGVFNPSYHKLITPCEYDSLLCLNYSFHVVKKTENKQSVFHLYHRNSNQPVVLPYDDFYRLTIINPDSLKLVRLEDPILRGSKVYMAYASNSSYYNFIASKYSRGNKKFGLYNHQGFSITPVIFDDIEKFSEFYFVVKLDDFGRKKIGVLYENGMEFLPVIYDSIEWVGKNFIVSTSQPNGTFTQDTIPVDMSKLDYYYKAMNEAEAQNRVQKEKEEREKHFIPASKNSYDGFIADYAISTHTRDTIFKNKGELNELKLKKFNADIITNY
jgi:hypothetical protein